MIILDALNNLFSITYFVHAVSGLLANVFAILLLYPLDTVRTRLQVQHNRKCEFAPIIIKDIISKEGWRSLYEGWSSLTVSVAVTSFIYFYIFHGLKLLTGVDKQSVYKDFLFGVIGGIFAVLFSNPLWVINTRLKLQHLKLKEKNDDKNDDGSYKKNANYNGILDCFLKVYNSEGLSSFFSGMKSSLLLVSNPAINFMFYELCKRSLLNPLSNYMSKSLLYLLFGACAKLVATIVTYPLQVIQTRSRAGLEITSLYMNQKTWRFKVSYFFRGLESKIIQTVLTSALMFLIYEHAASFIKI